MPAHRQSVRRRVAAFKGEMAAEFAVLLKNHALDRNLSERARRLLAKYGRLLDAYFSERKHRQPPEKIASRANRVRSRALRGESLIGRIVFGGIVAGKSVCAASWFAIH